MPQKWSQVSHGSWKEGDSQKKLVPEIVVTWGKRTKSHKVMHRALVSKRYYGSREESSDWTVETEGYLKRNTFSLNLLTRFCLSRHLTIDFSGGLTFFQFSGQVFPLGYAFFVTDKASLYLNTHKLILSIEPTVRLGLNTGGELNMPITGSFLLYFTVRYYFCPEASADTRIQKRLNPTQLDLIYNVLEESRAIMNPQPIKINPSFLNLGFGLKLRF